MAEFELHDDPSGIPMLEMNDADFDLWHKVPVCGCGDPPRLFTAYHAVLRTIPVGGCDPEDWTYGDQRVQTSGLDPLTYDVIAGVLDEVGATEHGGNISGAWLTETGQRLLVLFDVMESHDYEPSVVGTVTTVVR